MVVSELRPATTGSPLYDPTDPRTTEWFPINVSTALVTTAVEAARDIRSLLQGREESITDSRNLKALAVPVHSLGKTISDLQRRVDAEQRPLLVTSPPDALIGPLGRELRRAVDGDLRAIRNQRAAHHDRTQLQTPTIHVELVVDVLRPALCLWFVLMQVRGVYGWTRPANNGIDYEYMSEWPQAVLLSSENIWGPMAPHDPRRLVFEEIEETVECHNVLAMACEPPAQVIRLRVPE